MAATISNRAEVRNIELDQGSDFAIELTPVVDGDGAVIGLTGYTAEMKVRMGASVASTVMSLTSAGGEIVFDVGANKITVNISATTTAALVFSGAVMKAVYDLELTDSGGNVYKPIRGSFDVYKEITR